MSTKSSMELTKDNEHWYREHGELDVDEERVYIEIAPQNIKYFSFSDTYGVEIGIKGDSELAMYLKEKLS